MRNRGMGTFRLSSYSHRKGTRAFTILELLVSTTILLIILGIIFGITQQISNSWKDSSAKIEAFQGARAAFSSMTQQISQATLNTYYDYYNLAGDRRTTLNSSTFIPEKYGRFSDLHFISGGWSAPSTQLVPEQVTHSLFFQAPMGYSEGAYAGMDTLLNACGYYIAYNKDNTRPTFLDDPSLPNKPADRYRFRLMQFLQATQKLTIYPYVAGQENAWFQDAFSAGTPPVRILAENIIALIVLPKTSTVTGGQGSDLAPEFEYNSRPSASLPTQSNTVHQLPPIVEIVMVAIDEPSAMRICTSATPPDFGLAGLFKDASKLDDAADGTPGDLSTLDKNLNDLRVRHQIFRTQVAIRGSKWSEQ